MWIGCLCLLAVYYDISTNLGQSLLEKVTELVFEFLSNIELCSNFSWSDSRLVCWHPHTQFLWALGLWFLILVSAS